MLFRVAQKERNGILPLIIVNNDWYQWMVCVFLRKMMPRSAILVKLVVLILEHVIPGHVRFKIFTRKLKLCLKTRQKTLTILTLSMDIV